MTKLNNAYNYNARVDEDFGFQNRIYNLAVATLTAEVVQPVIAAWKADLDALDAALKQSQKSLATGEVENADRVVDRLYNSLKKYMEAFSNHPDPSTAKEAAKVVAIFEKYGAITHLGYDQQYGALANAMQDFNALPEETITLLSLTPWLESITLAEAKFQVLRSTQTHELGQFQAGLVKETRMAADEAYKKFTDTVNAFVIAFGEEDYIDFIHDANVIIDNLNANIKARSTRAKNSKEKDETTNTPDTPDTPETPESGTTPETSA